MQTLIIALTAIVSCAGAALAIWTIFKEKKEPGYFWRRGMEAKNKVGAETRK